MLDKPALRAKLRAARDGHAAMGNAFVPPPPFIDRLTKHRTVATYRPVGGEADPSLFDTAVHATGAALALPHVVDRETPIRFLHWPPNGALVPGPFGLLQPPAEAREVAPDIILAPLVGFTRRGDRLGQGAGHYDRAFMRYPGAWRVGIAWSVQEVDALPADPWDVPLHAIATETEWIVP